MANSTIPADTIHKASATKRMLQGAAVGLILVSAFLFEADEPDPLWPAFWWIRPMLVVPVAGAMGGLFFYFMDNLRYRGGWKKVVANSISALIGLVIIWLGTVIGFAGTMWN